MSFGTRLLTSSMIIAAVALLAACNKQGGTEPQQATGVKEKPAVGEPKKPSKPAPPTFALQVTAAEGKVGEALTTELKVVPKGEYKVNLEYPHKLKVSGPAAAAPREVALATKDAKVSKAELIFKPSFKLSAAGEHAFEGKLRFSVCTEKQCEIKAEKVKWVVKVTGE